MLIANDMAISHIIGNIMVERHIEQTFPRGVSVARGSSFVRTGTGNPRKDFIFLKGEIP